MYQIYMYLNKNDQIFKISQLTILKWIYDYNDARYMYIKYKDSTKKVMNVIEVVQMLVDKKY